MIAPGMNYVARHDINVPGGNARAYAAGDLVHESAVDGPDAWLHLGVEVDPVPGAPVPAPPKSAGSWAWASFLAATTDLTADELNAMGRDEMVAAHEKLTAPPPEPVKAPSRARSGGQSTMTATATVTGDAGDDAES